MIICLAMLKKSNKIQLEMWTSWTFGVFGVLVDSKIRHCPVFRLTHTHLDMAADSIFFFRDRHMALDKLISVHICLGFICLGFKAQMIKEFTVHVICYSLLSKDRKEERQKIDNVHMLITAYFSMNIMSILKKNIVYYS